MAYKRKGESVKASEVKVGDSCYVVWNHGMGGYTGEVIRIETKGKWLKFTFKVYSLTMSQGFNDGWVYPSCRRLAETGKMWRTDRVAQ
jgi:hypothetical protein